MKSRSQNILAHTLPGAPLLFVVLFSAFVTPSMAEEFVNISDIKGCRAIKDEQERLVCYDTVMDGGIFNEQKVRQKKVETFGSKTMPPVEPAVSEPSAPPVKAEVAKAPAESTRKSPPVPKKSKKDSSDSLAVTIVRTKKDGNGFYYFQTSEGQVWKQQNATKWTIDTPFEADIRAGALGSFFLEVQGSRGTRVKRVR